MAAKPAQLPALTIPRTPDELTPEWLTEALRRQGTLKDARVTAYQTQILGEGEGFIGTIARLRLELDSPEANAPASLIGKFPISVAQNRKLGEAGGAYEREIRFYTELADRVPLRTPRLYYADMDASPAEGREQQILAFFDAFPVWLIRILLPILLWLSGLSRRRYLLLLEDMAPGRVGDQVAGCSADEAERVLRALARTHAEFWNDPLESLYWVAPVNSLRNYFHVLYGRYHKAFLRNVAPRVAPEFGELAHWLREHDVELIDRLARFPLTLNHGDFRLDNMVFGADGELTMLDWQGPFLGPGAFDVAYFVTGSLPLEVARDHEEELIRAYHDELVTAGVRDHDFDEFRHAYDLCKLFVAYRMILLDLIDLSGDRGETLIERWLQRLGARLPTNWDELLKR